IEFWMLTSSTRFETIVSKRAICGHTNFWEIRMSSGRLSVEVDGGAAGQNYNTFSSNAVVNTGQFHHVVLARQAVTVSLYIDGALDNSQSTAGITDVTTTASMLAGLSPCVGVDGTNYFTGRLDEIKIFNRALTSTEVKTSYNAGNVG